MWNFLCPFCLKLVGNVIHAPGAEGLWHLGDVRY